MVWGSQLPYTLHKILSRKMDKKLYFAPEVEVIKLATLGMLAGSPVSDEGGEAPDLGPLNPGDEYTDPDA